MAKSWVLKTEPSTYSWDDLVADERTTWDGVANAAALINLRQMRVGDEALIYHSGEQKAMVGIARIIRAAYADPALDDARRVVVDIAPVRPLKAPVTLAQIKAEPALAAMPLVRISRLSCSPVTRVERTRLRAMGVR
jgi:predicted RNA-binding protein with PUA-like domain